MLIARYELDGLTCLGFVEGDFIRKIVSPEIANHPLFERLGVALPSHLGIAEGDLVSADATVPIDLVRLLAPVPKPGKIVCIGTNYQAHASEHGVEVPKVPEVFAKFDNTVNGPGRPILLNPLDQATDYEGELCVVLGHQASGLDRGNALGAVAGYTVANDVSARTWQLRVSQWTTGKSFDGFCPTGPWLATQSSVPDPQCLAIRTEVNGAVVQQSSTALMVFSVVDLLVYLSSVMTLEAGDLLLTGTPEGVGFHREPQLFLTVGDIVAVTIDSIGTLVNDVALRPGLSQA